MTLFFFLFVGSANRFWCLLISFSECLRTDLLCHYLRRSSEIKEKIIFTIYIFPDINIKVTGSKNSVDRGRRRRSHYFTLVTQQSHTAHHSSLTPSLNLAGRVGHKEYFTKLLTSPCPNSIPKSELSKVKNCPGFISARALFYILSARTISCLELVLIVYEWWM